MQESLISLQHFEKLLGPYGLYQHATKREPNLAEGYCVDDNARAVIVLLAHLAPGTYYNFRDAKGVWLTHDVSEDMYARLARTYTYTLDHDTNNDRKKIALELLIDLIPTLQSLTAPRAQAETVIALAKSPEFTDVATTHIQNLLALWKKESTPAWPWFEGSMTYANALLPHSVLIGLPLAPNDAQEYLHASAAFLIKTTIQNNIFTPIV